MYGNNSSQLNSLVARSYPFDYLARRHGQPLCLRQRQPQHEPAPESLRRHFRILADPDLRHSPCWISGEWFHGCLQEKGMARSNFVPGAIPGWILNHLVVAFGLSVPAGYPIGPFWSSYMRGVSVGYLIGYSPEIHPDRNSVLCSPSDLIVTSDC